MVMESQVFRAVRFCNVVPGLGQDVPEAGQIVGETQPNMEVRDAPGLEFKHPQVMNSRESGTQPSEPGIEVFFYGGTIRAGFVVRQAKLGYEP